MGSETMDATASMEPNVDDILQLCFNTLSGKSAMLSTSSSASAQEVSASIEDLLGIPSKSQRWLVDSNEIPFQQSLTMSDTNLQAGDHITVMHCGFTPLVDLPDAFKLTLTSVRQRFHTGYSSAFTVIYQIAGSIQEGWLYFEPWRKNDHDKLLYDIQAGTLEMVTSHWMAGSHKTQTELGEDPLRPLCHGWSSSQKQTAQQTKQFWRAGGTEDTPTLQDSCKTLLQQERLSEQQTHPAYSAVQGWFVSPSEDYNEIEVDVPLPSSGQKIIRLLIDTKGMPVRAAVKGCKLGYMHQDIEEFDIVVEFNETLSRPLSISNDCS